MMPVLRTGFVYPQPDWLQGITVSCLKYEVMEGCTGAYTDFIYILQQSLGNVNLTMSNPSSGAATGYGRRYPNGTWDGVTADLLKGKVDLSIAVYSSLRCQVLECIDLGYLQRVHIAAPLPKLKPFFTALLEIFSLSLWMTILFSLIILILVGWLMPRMMDGKLGRWIMALYNIAVFQDAREVHGTWTSDTWKSLRFRIVAGGWIIGTFYFGTLYSAKLTEHLVNPFEKPISTLHDMAYSRLPVQITPLQVVLRESISRSTNPLLQEISKRLVTIDMETWRSGTGYGEDELVFDDLAPALLRIGWAMKHAAHDGKSWLNFVLVNDDQLPITKLQYVVILGKVTPEWMRRVIRKVTTRLKETGIPNFLVEKRYKHIQAKLEAASMETKNDNRPVPFKLGHFKGVFLLHFSLLGLTVLVFIGECFVWRMKKIHRSMRNLHPEGGLAGQDDEEMTAEELQMTEVPIGFVESAVITTSSRNASPIGRRTQACTEEIPSDLDEEQH